jgi:hypothetical protein
MELVRSMMHSQDVAPKFWAEAMHTAIYVLNRTLSRTLPRTPFESWFQRKPSLSHLRTFGCPAYIYVEKHTRMKLDSKSRPGIFMGYAAESKAYWIWDTTKDKIVISRDVIFHESHVSCSFSPIPAPLFPFHVTIYFPKAPTLLLALPISTLRVTEPSPPSPFSPSSSGSHNSQTTLVPPDLLPSPSTSLDSLPRDQPLLSANNSTNPNSLNPELRTRYLYEVLNPVISPAESDLQDHLDLQLHPPARPTRLSKVPICYGDWAYFSNIVDETIVEPTTMIEVLSNIHKE